MYKKISNNKTHTKYIVEEKINMAKEYLTLECSAESLIKNMI